MSADDPDAGDRVPETMIMRSIGIVLLAVGVLLLVGLLPGIEVVPTVLGASVAVLALAVGTLLVSISRRERTV